MGTTPAGTNKTTWQIRINDNQVVKTVHRQNILAAHPSQPGAPATLLWADGVDEVRLYNTDSLVSQPTLPAQNHALGRYVLPTTQEADYRSPRYSFEGETTLLSADWTELALLAGSQGRIRTRVEVSGYDDAGNPVAPPLTLSAAGSVHDLSSLGPVRSFEYRVVFHNALSPGDPQYAAPLDETPVVESIRFTFRRPAHPVWMSWEQR